MFSSEWIKKILVLSCYIVNCPSVLDSSHCKKIVLAMRTNVRYNCFVGPKSGKVYNKFPCKKTKNVV